MSDFDSTFASRLVSARWFLLAAGVVVFAFAWPIDRSFQFDRRIERLFPEDAPAARAYQDLKREFGGNEIAVLSYPGADLFARDGSGIQRLREISDQVLAVPGVRSVLNLAKVSRALSRIKGFGDVSKADTAILDDDKLAAAFRELFATYTHSHDGNYAALVIMLEPDRRDSGGGSSAGADPTITGLRGIADGLPANNQPASLVGEPVLIDEGFTMAEADGRRLGTVTLGLLSIVILAMFRSPKWVVAQLVIIFWSTVVTRALLASLGLQLTLVSSMLTAVVTVVAVASVIHLAVIDRNAQLRGCRPREATALALSAVLRPIGWACLTDAVGFGSLIVSSVGPVRDFGMMMALGALVVFAAIVLFVPALASIGQDVPHARVSTGPFWGVRRPRRINQTMRRMLYGIYLWLVAHTKITIGFLALVVIGIWMGLSRLDVETNFIRNFRPGHRLAIDYGTVEEHLGGAGVWDVLLPAPQILSTRYLDSVMRLEGDLRSLGSEGGLSLTKVLSIADADVAARSNFALSLAPPSIRIAGMREAMPHFVNALVTRPTTPGKAMFIRIMMRSHEQAEAIEKTKLIQQVSAVILAHTSTTEWRNLLGESNLRKAPQVTGYSVLLTGLVAGLSEDQWTCFTLASIGVWVMLLIVSRSLRLSLCAMIPNVVPILGVIAALGLWGTKINLGTAMIAAVSVGISIDGSIHFLTAYRRAREFHDVEVSIQRIYRTVGVAVMLATVSLVIGFSTLITSPFVPTSTFGLLVSISLIVSSLANLTLLPFAMRLVETGRESSNDQAYGET